ncbi:MAG TPA: hypothetical protein VKU36_00255 [Candidatus Babeliales bacterium]|nr:hypothetical protein [Candidatus Babeliales bacterium]
MCAFLFVIALTATFSYAQKSDSIATIIDVKNDTECTHASTHVAHVQEPQPQKITITNAIQPHMLSYKHWTGTYNPDLFTVLVNNAEVAQGAAIEIPAETKTVNLTFNYSFVNGMRKGSKTVSYTLNENVTQATITFSWVSDNKIALDNGTMIAL